jgi:hypothetical protein
MVLVAFNVFLFYFSRKGGFTADWVKFSSVKTSVFPPRLQGILKYNHWSIEIELYKSWIS